MFLSPQIHWSRSPLTSPVASSKSTPKKDTQAGTRDASESKIELGSAPHPGTKRDNNEFG
ncbi:hypothetical protein SNOG_15935 [Parastagonospora nodorum SN15]|uniref:Uncharacterized protein n=1 Tax=Phaeosphaeria nodorum (strain SN15 / ATCC MYA-4574 / FGSC 10173) TaxID=321614 RepID=Q0TXB2_PHANO|nr:hypothetical protein SNOG_15935 [Parastagonospora nodorum SN15]EAT76773.1 hypothetical protein SNOG_15935 [Parastagonospora nodorum SN15]